MKRYLLATALFVGITLLSGCSFDDPFGATTRTQMRSSAQVQVAQAQANAQIAVAEESTEAKVKTAQTWAPIVPIALLIIVCGVIGAIIVTYQGKIHLARTENPLPMPPALPPVVLDKLKDHARNTGKQLYFQNGTYYLVDQTGKAIRALPRHLDLAD